LEGFFCKFLALSGRPEGKTLFSGRGGPMKIRELEGRLAELREVPKRVLRTISEGKVPREIFRKPITVDMTHRAAYLNLVLKEFENSLREEEISLEDEVTPKIIDLLISTINRVFSSMIGNDAQREKARIIEAIEILRKKLKP